MASPNASFAVGKSQDQEKHTEDADGSRKIERDGNVAPECWMNAEHARAYQQQSVCHCAAAAPPA